MKLRYLTMIAIATTLVACSGAGDTPMALDEAPEESAAESADEKLELDGAVFEELDAESVDPANGAGINGDDPIDGEVEKGGCVAGICGTIINHTSGVVGTAKDWCDGRSGPCPNTEFGVLQPGQSTPRSQDWDTWFTPSGCTDVGFSIVPVLGQVPWIVTGGWHKVHTPEDAHILTRSC